MPAFFLSLSLIWMAARQSSLSVDDMGPVRSIDSRIQRMIITLAKTIR